MSEHIQLGLFTPDFPEWENITMEWLFNYLSLFFPEMKFKIDKYINWDGEEVCEIHQTAFKKVQLSFDIGEYDECVSWCKNKNYVGCSTQQEYGHWSGMAETYNNWEVFKKLIPLRVQQCKEAAANYRSGNYEKLRSEVG